MTEIRYLNDLRGDFARLAQAEQHRTRRSSPRRTSPWRRRAIVVAAVTLAAVAGTVAVTTTGGGGHHSPGPLNLGPTRVPVGSNPFGSLGREVSLSQARSLAGFSVPTPDSALAGPHNLSKVWFGTWTNEDGSVGHGVVLDYVSSKIRIAIELAGSGFGSDPRAAFLREAASIGVPSSSVQTVNGAPALVVGASDGQPGFVEMWVNGNDIAIMGDYAAAEMVGIAGTIRA